MKQRFAIATLLLVTASLTLAQGDQLLQVAVTFASGRGVFIDKGRAANITTGMRVRLFPPGSAPVEGVVRAVSTDSALVELPEGIPLPPAGTKGEVEVLHQLDVDQDKQAEPEPQYAQPKRETPQHPPWSRRDEDYAPDTPLLAPAFGRKAQDRPVQVDGRLYGHLLYTKDRGDTRDTDFYLGRLGTWIEATNLLGQGGRVLFSGEVSGRGEDLFDVNDEEASDDNIRVDRLSYAVGGQKHVPNRIEGGRFYSIYVPELGLLDGIEGMVKVNKTTRAGAGIAVYPDPFPLNVNSEDTSFHMFVDYQSEAWHKLSAVLAYQKTWQDGAPDRDLLLGRFNLRPNDDFWVFASWKVDIYTGSDSIKGSGVGLTEFWAQVRYSPPKSKIGGSVSVSHFSWPELQRREFSGLPVDLIKNGKLDRLNLSSWYRLTKNFRLSARFDIWEDQDDNGTGGELSAIWTDPTRTWPSLFGSVYFTSGSFNDGTGIRIQARQGLGDANAFVGYELFRYNNVGSISGGDEQFARNTVRGGLDWNINSWHYSLSADYIFGDGEKLLSLGIFTQYRF